MSWARASVSSAPRSPSPANPRRDADDAAGRLPRAAERPRRPRSRSPSSCSAVSVAVLSSVARARSVRHCHIAHARRHAWLSAGVLRPSPWTSQRSPPARPRYWSGRAGPARCTILRLLAGLGSTRPRNGSPSTGTCMPTCAEVSRPREPDVGYVAQDFSLFPTPGFEENVGFGLRALGAPAERARRVERALATAGGPSRPRLPTDSRADSNSASPWPARSHRSRAAAARRAARGAGRADPPAAPWHRVRELLGRVAMRQHLRDPSPVEALVFGDRIVVVERRERSRRMVRARSSSGGRAPPTWRS